MKLQYSLVGIFSLFLVSCADMSNSFEYGYYSDEYENKLTPLNIPHGKRRLEVISKFDANVQNLISLGFNPEYLYEVDSDDFYLIRGDIVYHGTRGMLQTDATLKRVKNLPYFLSDQLEAVKAFKTQTDDFKASEKEFQQASSSRRVNRKPEQPVFQNTDKKIKLNAEEVFKKVSPSVLQIVSVAFDGDKEIESVNSGSGVVISPNLMVTNYHVVDNNPDAIANRKNGKPIFWEIIRTDKARDLALLQSKERFDSYADLSKLENIKVGQRVFAIGSPNNMTNTITEGLVSGIRDEDGLTKIQSSASITHGSSGGALINEEGFVIGITTEIANQDGNEIEFLSFAMPSDYVLELLNDTPQKHTRASSEKTPDGTDKINAGWLMFIGRDGFVDEPSAALLTIDGIRDLRKKKQTPWVKKVISTGLNNLHVFASCAINEVVRDPEVAKEVAGTGEDDFSIDNVIWDVFLKKVTNTGYNSDEEFFEAAKNAAPDHAVVKYLELSNKKLPKNKKDAYEALAMFSEMGDHEATTWLGYRYECDNNYPSPKDALKLFRKAQKQHKAKYGKTDKQLNDRIRRLELIIAGKYNRDKKGLSNTSSQPQKESKMMREERNAPATDKPDHEKRRIMGLIQNKINRNWVKPRNTPSGLSCTLRVRLNQNGHVVLATVIESSGNLPFDRSAEAAVSKAAPLPMPTDTKLINQFRDIRFKFKPN